MFLTVINLYLLVFLISIFGLGMILVLPFSLTVIYSYITVNSDIFSHIAICDQAFLGLRSIFFNNFLIDFFLLMMHFFISAEKEAYLIFFHVLIYLNIGPEYVYGAEHV
ncbi:hypothetical protein ACJX0J_036287 [Zea mays]